MNLARDISKQNLKSCIGNKYKVLVENSTFDKKFYVGRSYMDIPDTDGMVIIKNCENNIIGRFVDCEIIDIKNYDLIGKIKE